MAEKILVVDDDLETVRILQIFLHRLGYEALAAFNGPQAVEMARTHQPDLIILDVMMPGMDGFEVSRSLRNIPETAAIPVLMVTARTSADDKTRGYTAGADIYLTKPVHQMDLQANIKALVAQRQARKRVTSELGYMVGVIAAKGGLGVSSVALNLAAISAAQFGMRTIAAEMRPGQGTWADELNLSNALTLENLLRLDPMNITPDAVQEQLTISGFNARLLLSSNTPSDFSFNNDPAQYELILDTLREQAKIVVLDIGTYSSSMAPALLRQCSEVIVVTEPQPLSLKQTRRLLDRICEMHFGLSRPLTIVSVNHTGSDTSLPVTKMEDVLGRPVAIGIPPVRELTTYSIEHNVPVCMAQAGSLVSLQYTKLAEIVKTHLENV